MSTPTTTTIVAYYGHTDGIIDSPVDAELFLDDGKNGFLKAAALHITPILLSSIRIGEHGPEVRCREADCMHPMHLITLLTHDDLQLVASV